MLLVEMAVEVCIPCIFLVDMGEYIPGDICYVQAECSAQLERRGCDQDI